MHFGNRSLETDKWHQGAKSRFWPSAVTPLATYPNRRFVTFYFTWNYRIMLLICFGPGVTLGILYSPTLPRHIDFAQGSHIYTALTPSVWIWTWRHRLNLYEIDTGRDISRELSIGTTGCMIKFTSIKVVVDIKESEPLFRQELLIVYKCQYSKIQKIQRKSIVLHFSITPNLPCLRWADMYLLRIDV